MRRKERELSREEALAVIDSSPFMTLSMVTAKGQPYAVPLSMVREGELLYFHAALREGKKLECMRQNPAVCVSCVSEAERWEENYTMRYASAVVCGTAAEVTEEAEKRHALLLICQRYAKSQEKSWMETIDKGWAHTGIWKIRMQTVEGKANRR